MKKALALSLPLALLLASCAAPAEVAAASATAPAETTATAAPTEAPAAETPSPTPEATPAMVRPAALSGEYAFGEPYTLTEDVYGNPLPTEPLASYMLVSGAMSWDEAATAQVTVEMLKEANPYAVAEDGSLIPGSTLMVTTGTADYTIPDTKLRDVTVPHTEDYEGAGTYHVPAALDDDQAVALAEGLDALYHFDMSRGYSPAEQAGDDPNVYTSAEGARFTAYTAYQTYINAVFAPRMADHFLTTDKNEYGYYDGYAAGENDALIYTPGDRGANIMFAGYTYGEPKTAGDGTTMFDLLSLIRDDNEDPASPVTSLERQRVALVPTQDGWRVQQLALPN